MVLVGEAARKVYVPGSADDTVVLSWFMNGISTCVSGTGAEADSPIVLKN
jgi:hypothetical protein